jgi:proline iminopeptidase
VGALAGRPVEIVHGDADRICPPESARSLHGALPGSRLTEVHGAGHDPTHPGLVAAWRDALDRLHATLAPAAAARA